MSDKTPVRQRLGNVNGIHILMIGALPPPYGGTTVLFQQLVKELSQRTDVVVSVIDTSRATHEKSLFRDAVQMLRVVGRLVRALPRADVATFHSSTPGTVGFGPILVFLCKLFRVPLAVREFGNALDIDYEEMSVFFRWAIRTVFRADRVLLETKSLMKYFEKTFPEAKCEWYSNSREISPATSGKADQGRGARRFVFMGHVKADKGLNEILAASESLPFESCKIDVYGSLLDGFTEKNFENSRRVEYHGELTSENVMPTLRQYDVVLLPTHLREGYPGTIIEAYAAGLPVIATRCGAIGEIVEDGITGLLINPRDADALAEAMCKLCNDPELFRRLSEGALSRAHDFSSAVWTQRFVEICKDIVTERKTPELSGA